MTVSSMWHLTQRSRVTRSTSPQAAINYVIILVSYIWQTASMLQNTRPLFQILCRKPFVWVGGAKPLVWIGGAVPQGPVQGAKGLRALLEAVYRSMLIGLYCYALAVSEAMSSFAFRLWILAMALGWGSMQLLIPRFHVLPPCARRALDQWSFGQVLPTIVLLAPLFGVLEYLSTKESDITPDPPTSDPQPVEDPNQLSGNELSHLFTRMKENEPEAQQTLHHTLHTTWYFRVLLSLLTLIAIGSTIGLFVETVQAYIGPQYPSAWWSQDWLLWPDIVALFSVLALVFLIAIMGPIFSKRLSG